jgi:hypothetical protein
MSRPVSILVLASETAATDDLVAALSQRAQAKPTRFTLLMPAGGHGVGARRDAEPKLAAALERWHEAGLEADGVVGDEDPLQAAIETWDGRRYDEFIVSTLPGHASRWLRHDLPHRIARSVDAQVRHVVCSTPRVPLNWEPPPPSTRSSMGPLSVLAWGARRDRPASD